MYRVSRALAAALVLAVMAGTASTQVEAQATRKRRENATRQARIARNIQQTYSHKFELYGGGGFLRFKSGEDLQRNNEVMWNVGLTDNLSPVWGITADIRGHYGNAKAITNNQFGVYKPLITHYTFMAGPEYRFVRNEKYSVAAQVLGGAAMGNFDGGSKAVPAYLLGMWNTSTKPVFSVGVPIDYNVYTNFSLRVTPTWEATMFRGNQINADLSRGASTGSVQSNLGFTMGIVYRFGRQ